MLVRLTVLVGVGPLAICPERGLEIINRISALISGASVSNLQINHIPVGTVYQLMSSALRREARAHAWRQDYLFELGNEGGIALQNVNELVLPAVSVEKRQLAARGQAGEVYAEVLRSRRDRRVAASPVCSSGKRTAPGKMMAWCAAEPRPPRPLAGAICRSCCLLRWGTPADELPARCEISCDRPENKSRLSGDGSTGRPKTQATERSLWREHQLPVGVLGPVRLAPQRNQVR